MNAKPSRIASLAAIAAAISMGATPAAALDLPPMGIASADVAVETGAPEAANQHRYRGNRYRGSRYRGHGRHRGVDGGDVLAGVLVIGAIAAIAGASRERDRNRVRTRDSRDDDYRDDRGDDRRGNASSSGMERAADMCVEQVDRGRDRVADIEEARRTPDGWRVAGTLRSGDGWSCWIDNDGRIRNVDIGVPGYSANDGDARLAPTAGEQWNADAYTSARANVSTPGQAGYSYRDEPPVASTVADGPQPAYPGGPLPGEEGYDEALQGAAGQGDGRYTVAESSDFTQSGN